MTILVVDDENIVLDSCRIVLEAEGYTVMSVASSDTALEVIEDVRPSLLLIDVKMPRHNGMYLMEKVKRIWPNLPVVAMSGYLTQETIENAARTGANAFLAKPFTPDELMEAVTQAIGKEII